jgi:ElaB/YqjD/DUF883 family membrane-anchored ribosome-binding protein
MAQNIAKKDIDLLKKDADRVVRDISKLSGTIGKVGKEATANLGADLSATTHEELEKLREKLGDLEVRGRQYATALDESVKKNPYAYLIGFLGLGFLLGKLLFPRKD